MAVASLDHPTIKNAILPIGGPASLSQREVIGIFENVAGAGFAVEQIPQAALEQQFAGAQSPMDKSFASLMLALARGLPMNMKATARELGITLSSVEAYAQQVLSK